LALYRGQLPQLSDEELVIDALIGDLAAYDELVRRYRGAVMATAEQVLGSREGAEDVAQEALLLAFKALPQLEDPARFGGWLYTITRHRAHRVATREGYSQATEDQELDRLIVANSHELGVSPVDELMRKVERATISTALERLPADYQMVLRLRYFQEWPVERIAAFLLLPVTTVKWRLHHGRQLMRRQINFSQGSTRKRRRGERVRG